MNADPQVLTLWPITSYGRNFWLFMMYYEGLGLATKEYYYYT